MIARTKIPNSTSGIYQLQSKMNGKVYIGSAIDLKQRKRSHFLDLQRGLHANAYLQNHVTVYGIEDLIFSIIEFCSKSDLIQREQYQIDIHSPQFNICKVAGSALGVKRTEEFKQKARMSKMHCKGYLIQQYTKEGIFIRNYKSAASAAMQTKIQATSIVNCCKNKQQTAGGFIWTFNTPPTLEQLQSVGKISSVHLLRSIPVDQFDLDGRFIRRYFSVGEASRTTKINQREIRSCIHGRQRTSHDFIFKITKV